MNDAGNAEVIPPNQTASRPVPVIAVWARDLLVSLAISAFIIIFLYQPVKVEGTSMMPGLEDQERIFVNKFVYRWEPIQRGDIVVDGMALTRDTRRVDAIRREVGMVFQHFNLFPHLTVLENCTLAPIQVRGMPKRDAEKRAMHFLARVKIPEQAGKYPSQLSGGQQQRVAIARALCMSPKLMMFDEPTSALDPEMVKEVLDTMVALALDGMTMLVVTHEMTFARQVANRIVFMDAGQIIEINEPAPFFANPQHERTKLFLSQILH